MKYSPDYYAQMLYTIKDADAFLALVKRHWVTPWLPTILFCFEALIRKKEKVARVSIISVHPLSGQLKANIENIISAHNSGGRMEFEYVQNANVLGGFRAQSQEMIIEGSLYDKLNRLLLPHEPRQNTDGVSNVSSYV